MLIRLVAYHHRNPVEAGVVAHARDSNWTSHRIYLRLEPAPPFFDVERALSVLGFSDTEAGRRRFDDMVMDLDLSDWRPEKLVTKPVFTSEPATVEWRRLVAAALHVTGLSDAQLAKRCGKGVVARRLIATMAREDFGQTYQRIGEALGMSTGAVSNLLGRKSLDAALVDRARARYSELADAA